ncbi:MAG: ACT domain-containing protein [Anaerolineae bacterium]|nr:ACT domain-containing protein [Anaerolineae bacterium]MDQ7035091.1 ACT domain-containing protein [Anaerolineae bacterium]
MMSQSVDDILAQAELYSDDDIYRFITLPANAITAAASVVAQVGNPFIALLVDKDEVTLMLEDEDYHEYQKRLLDHQVSETRYRLITFDVVLESTLVGFMARVTQILADANISVMPFAAFSRDHIFVSDTDFEKAMQVLAELKSIK